MEKPGGAGGGRCAQEFKAHSAPHCLPGLSGPSLEDGVGLFLSAFLLLGLIKALGWAGKCKPHPGQDLGGQLHSACFPEEG